MAGQEALGPGGQQHAGAGLVDGAAGGTDALHCELERIERVLGAAGRVLDREAGYAGRDTELDVGGDAVGRVGIAVLEIGIDRQVRHGLHQLGEMRQHHVARHVLVGAGPGEGEAGAGRSQSRKALSAQPTCRAFVPGIGHDEAAGFMKPTEDLDLRAVRHFKSFQNGLGAPYCRSCADLSAPQPRIGGQAGMRHANAVS